MFAVVHPSTPSQLEQIFALRYAVLRAPWNQPRGSEKDESETSAIHAMILSDQDECIATGRLQLNSETEGQIRFMAVSEEYRGKKLGKLILEFLESKARAVNCKTIVLQARENAVEFYKAQGYILEENTFLLFDSIQHYRMRKDLF